MFKAVLAEPDLLKNSIPIIAEILDEATFKITQNGISLLSPDRAMVSVVDFKILSTAFEEFKVDKEMEIGLNMANLVAVIKRAKGTDKLSLEATGDKLKIVITGDSVRKFDIPLLDVQAETPPVDQLKFEGKVDMESSVIEEGISDAEIIGDSVFFEAGPTAFRMFSKGETSMTELEMKKGDKQMLGLEAKEKLKSQYPLEYLKKMIKASRLSQQLTMEFGNDYPLRLSFKTIDKLMLSFILAPRVQED
jgi:proliferating cell nuclear antigen